VIQHASGRFGATASDVIKGEGSGAFTPVRATVQIGSAAPERVELFELVERDAQQFEESTPPPQGWTGQRVAVVFVVAVSVAFLLGAIVRTVMDALT
jgi:hypothetical protein